MAYKIIRTTEEIDNVIDICAEAEAENKTKYRGMTYEQGVRAAIEWLTDATVENPIDEDEP